MEAYGNDPVCKSLPFDHLEGPVQGSHGAESCSHGQGPGLQVPEVLEKELVGTRVKDPVADQAIGQDQNEDLGKKEKTGIMFLQVIVHLHKETKSRL